jgi:hypothetical protein
MAASPNNPLIAQANILAAQTGPRPRGANGPLQALDQPPKGQSKNYWYPQDIGTNPTKAHCVVFTIKDVAALNGESKPEISVNPKGLIENKGVVAALDVPKTGIVATITLYMPDTLNMSYSSNYESFELTTELGTVGRAAEGGYDMYKGGKNLVPGLVETGGGAAFNAVTGSEKGGDILLRATGYAVNPQLQLLYKGINLREYQLEFIFTPKSTIEADMVKSIIDTFTYASLPQISGAAAAGEGQYFVMPSIFNLSFKFINLDGSASSIVSSIMQNPGTTVSGGSKGPSLSSDSASENLNLYKVGDSVLTNITVDYAPNGFAAYQDGFPVQTRLTLQFKEMNIMHRDIYNKDVR